MAVASASSRDFLSTRMGASVMLRSIVMCGKRLKCWNTMPIFWRWRSMFVLGSVMSTPSKYMLPSVGSSRRFSVRREGALAAAGGADYDDDLARSLCRC